MIGWWGYGVFLAVEWCSDTLVTPLAFAPDDRCPVSVWPCQFMRATLARATVMVLQCRSCMSGPRADCIATRFSVSRLIVSGFPFAIASLAPLKWLLLLSHTSTACEYCTIVHALFLRLLFCTSNTQNQYDSTRCSSSLSMLPACKLTLLSLDAFAAI